METQLYVVRFVSFQLVRFELLLVIFFMFLIILMQIIPNNVKKILIYSLLTFFNYVNSMQTKPKRTRNRFDS
jgi:hypothetical protein